MPEETESDTNVEILELDEALKGKKIRRKIDGKEEIITLDDALRRADLETVSRKRMQEAREIVKGFEDDSEGWKLFVDGVTNQDAGKIATACRRAGLSDEQIQGIVGDPGDGEADPAANGRANPHGGRLDGGDASEEAEELREMIRLQQRQIDVLNGTIGGAQKKGIETRQIGQVKSALDSDEAIAQYLGRLDDDLKDEVYQTAFQDALKASKTLTWGPKAVQHAVERAKKRLKAFGAGQGGDDTQDRDFGDGLGPAGMSASTLHRREGEPKPVSVKDRANYTDNATARLRSLMGFGKKS